MRIIFFLLCIAAVDVTVRASTVEHTYESDMAAAGHPQLSVLRERLQQCGTSPMTGWRRDGFCSTDAWDAGSHTVCADVTADFLAFTRSRGNDLSTPRPPGFPGLRPGDKWCLCSARWLEAHHAGVAPPVHLAATNAAALRTVTIEQLRERAMPPLQ